MPISLRTWAGFAVFCALAGLPGCSHDRGPISCEGALGVHRTIPLTGESGPILSLLEENEVILSFDDGPHVHRTLEVLDLLDRDCTRATFFLVGKEAAQQPRIVRIILDRGHTLGGHTWSHPDLSKLPVEDAMADIQRGNEAIAAAAGQPVRFFRFPYIASSPDLHDAIEAADLIDVTVTADGADWTKLSPKQSVATIMNKLEANQRRGVILLHDTYARSDDRTRLLLQSLKTEGYRVVAISDQGG